MMTLDERQRKFNEALSELALLYGLKPDVDVISVDVTQAGMKGYTTLSKVSLFPIDGWVEPQPLPPPSADNPPAADAS